MVIKLPCCEAGQTEEEAAVLPRDWMPEPIEERRTVLFADDEETVRSAISEYLRNLGYEMISAKDGQECLDLFHRHADAIDILLLDMNMPKKSGADVINAIGERAQDYRIFVSTGYSSEQNSVYKDDPRITKVLEKPYNLGLLARTLAAH